MTLGWAYWWTFSIAARKREITARCQRIWFCSHWFRRSSHAVAHLGTPANCLYGRGAYHLPNTRHSITSRLHDCTTINWLLQRECISQQRIQALVIKTTYYSSGWWFMVLNPTFNNISVISWLSVLLVEETRVPGENHRPVASHWQTLSHNVVSSTSRHERDSNSQH